MVFVTDLGAYCAHTYPIHHLTGVTVIPAGPREHNCSTTSTRTREEMWIILIYVEQSFCLTMINNLKLKVIFLIKRRFTSQLLSDKHDFREESVSFKGTKSEKLFLPVLVHELLLSDGEGAQLVAQGVFILQDREENVEMDRLINTITYKHLQVPQPEAQVDLMDFYDVPLFNRAEKTREQLENERPFNL